ncbi:MAG TPA: response regulator [Longimicrobiales bacterium]|nr:response regulator [Longimicrobiales bacterium]
MLRLQELLVIADDSELIRLSYSATLTTAGYPVLCAADGEDAVRLAREYLPRLLLLDLAMPAMDGIAVVEALKADEHTAGIAVVAMTGYDVAAAELRRLGFIGVISKPLTPDELVAAVKFFVASSAAGRAWAEFPADADLPSPSDGGMAR